LPHRVEWRAPSFADRKRSEMTTHLSRRAVLGGLAASAAAAWVSGCAPEPEIPPAPSATTPTLPTVPVPQVTVVPTHGADAAWPTDTLAITVQGGTFDHAVLVDQAGNEIGGTYLNGVWRPARNLLPETSYTAIVTARDGLGAKHEAEQVTFTTLEPKTTALYDFNYVADDLGIGMVPFLQFASDVLTPEMRLEVERNLYVEADPWLDGAWGWVSDKALLWRPNSVYVPPGAKITVHAALGGVQTGEDKWVGKDQTVVYGYAPTHKVIRVSRADFHLRMYEDDKLVEELPCTTGTTGSESREGCKPIFHKEYYIHMTAESLGYRPGGSGYYEPVDAYYCQQMTKSGEFIHSAPWSQSYHGRANVSHGCTGLSVARAKIVWDWTTIGVPVEYSASPRTLELDNGIPVWVHSYDDWRKLGAAYQ
jgi:lipoprotein-anchoring transpeptidase ErfK/SrfK